MFTATTIMEAKRMRRAEMGVTDGDSPEMKRGEFMPKKREKTKAVMLERRG